jgi:hypothetical protein
MREHLDSEAALRKLAGRYRQLTGQKLDVENPFELERVRSLQVASVALKPVVNHPSRFGALTWPMSLINWS